MEARKGGVDSCGVGWMAILGVESVTNRLSCSGYEVSKMRHRFPGSCIDNG